ncbi:Acyl transferase/acyl hydrolase/lysophospholipase [Pseudocohnilembus persalinus]|uniref:Acyl transferase/acyl hydrolase/lysophospholipase n=1 Tax=Pseudocohnilembus persalinus TaxID=266149 RepID=A0A0V0QZM3_PSEPJ|nr:Acyl transferase/acyl hydrolase/lysophospholipase [Pseudocohnilembus persalinus]|eukprot:KRX07659.1 Acyl transferase/acyl hydrolase/lysophospholipase [Pseudocohnilembus persalinus]
MNTKQLIQQFMEEVRLCVQYLLVSKSITQAQKFEFLVEQKHALGRTALIFSGGGLFALYSFGILQMLIEEKVFPKIIAGSSAGSIVASLVASCTEEEISIKLRNQGELNFDAFISGHRNSSFLSNFWKRVKKLFKEGVILDIQKVEQFVKDNIGDITFQEAYDKTGRILNITVTGSHQHSQQNNLLNYITAPHVVIWSAVACSCSIPFIYGSSTLKCKNELGEIVDYISNTRFVDGSIGGDLPMLKLAELFNVTNFIVSQTNPFIVPFIDRLEQSNSGSFKRWMNSALDLIKNLIIEEIKHRIKQFSKLNLVPHNIQILSKLFDQQYTGNITIFPKPSFSDYLLILDVPSSDDQIKYFKQQGYKQTFEKVYQIKMQTYYERIIEKAYQTLCKIEQSKTPLNMKINQNGTLEVQIAKKNNLGNSQYLFNDSQSDDLDKLNDIRNQKSFNNNNPQMKTGFSQIFEGNNKMNNSESQDFSNTIQVDSDKEYDCNQKFLDNEINLAPDDQVEGQNLNHSQQFLFKNGINNKQQQQRSLKKLNRRPRNYSFTIPRSQSKEFLKNLNEQSLKKDYKNKRGLQKSRNYQARHKNAINNDNQQQYDSSSDI